MSIQLGTPGVGGLRGVVDALRDWQDEGAPMQLHPGDVGWFWRFGADRTAAAVRAWTRDGRIVATGLLDGPTVLRLTIAPDLRRDEELARRIVDDIIDPARGVLPEGKASVESPVDAPVDDLLGDEGWRTDEPWTPLHRDLAEPPPDPGIRVEVVGPDRADVRAAVQRASFERSTFTDERWRDMAAGPAYADDRCLLGYDDEGTAVATATVWSAGPGRPGLLEPVGVDRDHRRHGYGTAISVAAAAALRELGSSSAIVCTPSSNVGAVATYTAAGFRPWREVRDRARDAEGAMAVASPPP